LYQASQHRHAPTVTDAPDIQILIKSLDAALDALALGSWAGDDNP
jgi:hypothetical protein